MVQQGAAWCSRVQRGAARCSSSAACERSRDLQTADFAQLLSAGLAQLLSAGLAQLLFAAAGSRAAGLLLQWARQVLAQRSAFYFGFQGGVWCVQQCVQWVRLYQGRGNAHQCGTH